MSDRDHQNPDERSYQQGGGNRWEDENSPGQANQWQADGQWQTDGDRQQGGFDHRGSRQRGGFDDQSRDYRFGQGGSAHGGYGARLNEDRLRNDNRDASHNYERARGGYGQSEDSRRDQDRPRQQGGSQTGGYAGRDYDASGGNDFGNFTSEDYGGRDFYNRGGSASGGARSSESYRPSFGLSSWRNDDDGDRQSRRPQGHGREDYGSWRQYGENRGFLKRAGDEIASWFGDEDASRRRDQDHREDPGSSQGGYQGQSHRGRGPSNYTRSDDRIREDANDHLTHDWGVDATHITVSVKDGELTLDGTVDGRQAKRRAEDAVEHISGVKHVQNNLRVQERNSSYGASSSSGGGSSGYGQGSGSALTGSGSASAGSGSGTGSGSIGTGQGGSTDAGSSGSTTTGANTASGIGSTAGAGGASSTRAGDKTS